ncbi:hypothetical protein AB0M83_27185 [Amycolatopsis sp. NPDC051106]|uniref:hypothetical protein n=1 Tax=unclassified Amycolatopsis TaxID=2618356 RepID=UPI003444A443
MRPNGWSHQTPAAIVDLTKPGTLAFLVDRYCGTDPEPVSRRRALINVIETALNNGARTAVIEYRYNDLDYQDEHSRFYSRTFRQYPGFTHRLHFFLEPPPTEVYDDHVAAVFDDMQYLGYCVLRPVSGAPVGRTMLAVPDELAPHVACAATDVVNFFGKTYSVTAAPFMAQDSQLGICAHAAAWTVSYFHRLRYGSPRHLPGAMAAAPMGTDLGRPVPSPGLTIGQLSAVLQNAGLPPLVYRPEMLRPTGETLESLACRYLDSALPVIVGTHHHCFVLVGYKPGSGRNSEPQFICQDDEVGPYQLLPARTAFAGDPWQCLVVPLPDQLYVPVERAEPIGRTRLEFDLTQSAENLWLRSGRAEGKELLRRLRKRNEVEYVTTAIRSTEFKQTRHHQLFLDSVKHAYLRIPMPKWIWVVELVDRARFRRGEPAVLAEAVIDSTDHSRDMHVIAWRVPGLLRHWDSDDDRIGDVLIDDAQPPTRSVCATLSARGTEQP